MSLVSDSQLDPPWLRGPYGGGFMAAIRTAFDQLLAKCAQAQSLYLPGHADPSALPAQGWARQIVRGIAESDAAYGARLSSAYSINFYRGSARGILIQVLGSILPSQPRASVVSNSSAWDTYAAGADITEPPTHTRVSPADWNWDGYSAAWWRAWVIVELTGWCTDGRKWGDGWKFGDGTLFGVTAPSGIGDSLRAIVKNAKPSHCRVPWIIVNMSPSDTLIPAAPAGDPSLPDGTWGRWSKIVDGVSVPARSSKARYILGVD